MLIEDALIDLLDILAPTEDPPCGTLNLLTADRLRNLRHRVATQGLCSRVNHRLDEKMLEHWLKAAQVWGTLSAVKQTAIDFGCPDKHVTTAIKRALDAELKITSVTNGASGS